MTLDYVALAIMVLLIGVLVLAAVKLGALPGKIAGSRNHPQVDAIRVCGWLGLLTLGILWPLALIWAYTKPLEVACSAGETGGGEPDKDLAPVKGPAPLPDKGASEESIEEEEDAKS